MEKIRRKKVSMEDVAHAAGVSITTVSHVVNQTANISAATSDLVRQAVARLGYVPRSSAKMNCGQRIIGVFTPEISNEFYSRSVQAIFQEAWLHDYAVMICSMQHHYRAELSYIRSLIQTGVQGLIFFGGSNIDEKHIREAARRVPVVLGDRRLPGTKISSVGTDNTDIMRKMVGRLHKSGYTEIGYVSEDLIMSNARDRYIGYKTGMEEHALHIDRNWVWLLPELRLNKIESAYCHFLSVLEEKKRLPQVLLCTSDLIAIGVMAALKKKGLQVPREIGVVGFDDITIAAFTDPPLTSIAQNTNQLGKKCFALLLRQMEDAACAPQDLVVRARIVVRNSVRL